MEKQQIVDGDPCPDSISDGQVCHMTKGQNRPEVMVATEGPGEPGPMDGWSRIPLLEPPRLHRQLKSYIPNQEHEGHVNGTRPDDLEPKEEEPKGEKVGEVRVGR